MADDIEHLFKKVEDALDSLAQSMTESQLEALARRYGIRVVHESEFVTKLQQYRIESGYSQEELAERLGVSQSLISRIEGGEFKRLNMSTLNKLKVIATEIGTTVGDLIVTLKNPYSIDSDIPDEEKTIYKRQVCMRFYQDYAKLTKII